MQTTEKALEDIIEETLIAPLGADGAGGYRKRQAADYDRALCLDADVLIDFVVATQPKEWEKLKKQHGTDVRAKFTRRVAGEVEKRGVLSVLRRGVRDSGCSFQLAYFQPASGLNPELQRVYAANQFSVVRQLRYSQKSDHSLDLALFLNGLPIFTAELKNQFTGQSVEDAMQQYRTDRDPREPLLRAGRCLAHFAVDPNLVYVTTQLDGHKTRFLPFNRGRYGGAGNAPSALGAATAYLWEEIWTRDSVLNLIQQFIHEVTDNGNGGNGHGKRVLLFPRYHQLDAVRRLVADARENGPGARYLIQHSAGSGKSNSIAWLAHQLSVLHDASDRRVFDSIIIVTDRRVLDRQLQRTVQQFEQTLGVVENIDTTSRQLKAALENGKTIIVTTLQKFPVILNQMTSLPGSRFALIIDEAHSSQTGETAKSMKQVLSAGSLEQAEADERDEGDDLEDMIAAEMRARQHLPNVSTFAFTATPKPKTLELFGTRRPDGTVEAFSLYPMRQAIEEKFILDVLANYTTYTTFWNLHKKIEEDPRYDPQKATYLLRQFVELHPHAIHQKVAIIVDHFAGNVMQRIEGKAKAMIVTRSRLHAVRFKHEVDAYLKQRGYPFKALVAFSGTVKDGDLEFTETGMNGIPETQTAETFKRDEYRLLIVAEKFQTGFDQPLLHTMYVDKKLAGVHAVQTLSRLNRTHPAKTETMVLDFVNDALDIQAAFQPYYERTILSEETDPNLLYDLQTALEGYGFFTQADVDRFARVFFVADSKIDKLHAAVDEIVERLREADEDALQMFRSELADYARVYGFLSQVIRFVDTNLEKLYHFCRFVIRKIPARVDELPREVEQSVDIESFRIQYQDSGTIDLERGIAELPPTYGTKVKLGSVDELEPLSEIIRELNERFGTDFSEEDRVFINQLELQLEGDEALKASVRINPPENAKLTFDHVVSDRMQGMIDTNFKFYKQFTDDEKFASWLLEALFERYRESAQ
jgi:type I restriction enzyme, R subunit